MVVGTYMSNFELFYYLITSNYYLAASYKYYRQPLSYAARVMPLRADPLAAVCAAAPGGWAPG